MRLSFSFVMFVCSMCGWAQVPLSSGANSYRSGDRLCKVLTEYVAPGEAGVEQVWQLGRITDNSEEYRQLVASSGDTIAIFEDERIRHFLMHGDTLVDKGGQSRRAYCLYDIERPLLRYPFQYGDSIGGSYMGEGRNENTRYKQMGWGYTKADGMGMLTDGEDTLQHIMRLHLYDRYTIIYQDSTQFDIECNRHTWYCSGYRYPVMESWHWVAKTDTLTLPLDSISCLYLPIMQTELAEDLANDSILQVLASAEALQNSTSPLASIQAGLSSDGMSISVDFILTEAIDVSFCACDILGNILGQASYENREAGEWQECLVLSRRPIGNVVMLNVKCGEENLVMKVYK